MWSGSIRAFISSGSASWAASMLEYSVSPPFASSGRTRMAYMIETNDGM